MRLIFSRKGFDSKNGGVPSPILPDGRMCSLPIPDSTSEIRYSDIRCNDLSLGQVVSDLTGNRIEGTTEAHLDPDINPDSLPRRKHWTGIFGPSGPAYTHLLNCGFSEDDLFLFFGWFRETQWKNGALRFVPRAPDVHVIFGWLKVGTIKTVGEFANSERRWADYHPHFSPYRGTEGVICLAQDKMKFPKSRHCLPGFGVFPTMNPSLRLTAPSATRSRWRLPKWFMPTIGKTPLSCHGDLKRWHKDKNWAYLDTVPIGQEFVLNCDDYPQINEWLHGVFRSFKGSYDKP
jgi:hypothetical protein